MQQAMQNPMMLLMSKTPTCNLHPSYTGTTSIATDFSENVGRFDNFKEQKLFCKIKIQN
jgi:hypothetical protein